MNQPKTPAEYLVISRGKWDPSLSPEQIQQAIDEFYVWLDSCVADGTMKTGQRLGTGGRMVTRTGVMMDGPFVESKEVIGGIWFIIADNLDDAAALAAQNPCLRCGLHYEIRPIETATASAFAVTNETPDR